MTASDAAYDVIVIGGGLAGLTCAALLAQAGFATALVEKNRRIGGYAATYRTHGHRFDIAIQAIGGGDPSGIIMKVLRLLNITEAVEFLPCDPARVYHFIDPAGSVFTWKQPGTHDAQVFDLSRLFPGHRHAIEKAGAIFHGIMEELTAISYQDSAATMFGFPRSFPLLARYGHHTLGQFMDELALPADLRRLVTARCGYSLLPPERLSLVGFACTEATYGNGAWMVRGGVQRLTAALATAFRRDGGHLMPQTLVRRLLLSNGRTAGVETDDGRRLKAPVVVAAGSVPALLEELCSRSAALPARYGKRLASMEATGSYYIAYCRVPLAATRDLWPNMEIIDTTEPAPWPAGTWYLMIPSMVDDTCAPEGFHSVCISEPLPPGQGLDRAGRQRCRIRLLQRARQQFPQLAGRLDFLFDLGPDQFRAISANREGSAYGWALLPGQTGLKRLNFKTPLPGLYLAGHWTMPGGGIAAVTASAELCARAIMKDTDAAS